MSEDMYGFNDSTESEELQSNYLEPGIQENLEFTEIAFVPEKDDSSAYLNVEMIGPGDKTVNRRYYQPKMGGFVTDEAELKKAVNKFNKVLANLARKFLGEDYVAQGNSFESVCKKVISDIGDKYKGVKLRAVVVLNTNNFPTLRGYAPVWELMTVDAKDSKLKIQTYDKVSQTDSSPDNDYSEGTKKTPTNWA
jgi:hypothetical protein